MDRRVIGRRRWFAIVAIAASTCALVAPPAQAIAPAAPDSTFGKQGQLRSKQLRVSELLPLPGGSFYVLGTRSTQEPLTSMLQKRQSDGTPDRSFGDGKGEVVIKGPASIGPVSMHAAYLLADGRVLMYGYIDSTTDDILFEAPDDRIVFVRLLADGSPDRSFSGDGFMWHPAYQGSGESYPSLRLVPATSPVGAFGFEVTTEARSSLHRRRGARDRASKSGPRAS